jgi:hypothetical protein
MRSGLAGALLALVVVGGFMALDRTTLHWYAEKADRVTVAPTQTESGTLWYYVYESAAQKLVKRYGTQLPPCNDLIGNGNVLGAVPASVGAPPIASAVGQFDAQVAIECHK